MWQEGLGGKTTQGEHGVQKRPTCPVHPGFTGGGRARLLALSTGPLPSTRGPRETRVGVTAAPAHLPGDWTCKALRAGCLWANHGTPAVNRSQVPQQSGVPVTPGHAAGWSRGSPTCSVATPPVLPLQVGGTSLFLGAGPKRALLGPGGQGGWWAWGTTLRPAGPTLGNGSLSRRLTSQDHGDRPEGKGTAREQGGLRGSDTSGLSGRLLLLGPTATPASSSPPGWPPPGASSPIPGGLTGQALLCGAGPSLPKSPGVPKATTPAGGQGSVS